MKRALLILLLPLQVCATSFYVDNAATGGNDGSSWTDAWVGFTNIVWGSVTAGSTVYVSGGATSKTYVAADQLNVQGSGTAGSPITIALGQDTGHNGNVVFATNILILAARSNIVLSGAKSGTFNTNGINPLNPWAITNNIGFYVWPTNITAIEVAAGILIQATNGIKIRWCDVMEGGSLTNNMGTNYNDGEEHWITYDRAGIYFSGNAPHYKQNMEVGYCYVHHNCVDGIHEANSRIHGLGKVLVHHCVVAMNVDDNIEVGSGWDICYNWIGMNHNGPNPEIYTHYGDGDTIQCPGMNTRIYNNVLVASGAYYQANSIIRSVPVLEVLSGQGATNTGNYLVYGNLAYCLTNDISHEMLNLHPRFENYDASTSNGCHTVWTNIVLANNTVARSTSAPAEQFAPFEITTAVYNWWIGLGVDPTNISFTVTDGWILNNVNWYIAPASSGSAVISALGPATVDYNTLAQCGSSKMLYYTDSIHYATNTTTPSDYVLYATPTAFNSARGMVSNVSATVLFADTNANDFRLSSADTGARNTGTNLSGLPASVLADMPDYDKDLTGQTRGQDGAWDRGALEYSSLTNGLLVWLEFEHDFSGGTATDSSGNARHMLRYGYASYPTNWTTRTNDCMAGSYAANFQHYEDTQYPPGGGYSLGDYGGITNLGEMLTLTQMTLSVWAKWNETTYQNGGLVDASYGVTGGWKFGRTMDEGDYAINFEVYTNDVDASANAQHLIWPDVCYNGILATNTPWWHYLVTVNCASGDAVVNGYWHGTNIGTMTVPDITNLTVYAGGGVDWPWLGIGVTTHQSTPSLDDGPPYQPNSGWFNGKMDDLRIYNRVLTLAEIAELAGEEAPEPEPPAAASGTLTLTGTLRTTTWRTP